MARRGLSNSARSLFISGRWLAFAALAMFAAPLPARPHATRVVSLCTAAGVRTARIPLEDDGRPSPPDCGHACHSGCDRRKPQRGN